MKVISTAAIVMGAASGLGAPTSAALAESGASVYGSTSPRRSSTRPKSRGVTDVPVDVADPLQTQDAVDRANSGLEPLRFS